MKAKRPLTQEFGHTFQLIDQVSGKVVANIDEWSDRRYHDFVIGRIYRFAQNMEDIANTPRNRALWLTLSLWQKNDDGTYQNYAISESAQRLLSESHAILTEFVLHTETETASTPSLATFADGFTLHRANFPALARAGTPLNVDFTWSTANDGAEDWTQFLHFVHEEERLTSGTTTSRRWERAYPLDSGMPGWWIKKPGNSPCPPTCPPAAASFIPACIASAIWASMTVHMINSGDPLPDEQAFRSVIIEIVLTELGIQSDRTSNRCGSVM